jgi:hypothetical protein
MLAMRPLLDLSPIRLALARLMQVCPDQYALAKFGIVEVWHGVRSWAPFQLADGVGWHARYIYPGVMIDFVYGWAGGIERVLLVKLGVPQPDTPTHVYFSLGFVLLDSSGLPLGLPPTASDAPGPPVAVEISPSGMICAQQALEHLVQILIADLPSSPSSSTGGGKIAAAAKPLLRSCSTEQWLPGMYLPAHVPRRAGSDRMDKPRPLAESIWENTMFYYDKEIVALWNGCAPAFVGDAGDADRSNPIASGIRSGRHYRRATAPTGRAAARAAASSVSRSMPIGDQTDRGVGPASASASMLAMIASADNASAYERRLH